MKKILLAAFVLCGCDCEGELKTELPEARRISVAGMPYKVGRVEFEDAVCFVELYHFGFSCIPRNPR